MCPEKRKHIYSFLEVIENPARTDRIRKRLKETLNGNWVKEQDRECNNETIADTRARFGSFRKRQKKHGYNRCKQKRPQIYKAART